MLTARLRARCPSALALSTARLDDHDIAFDKIGQDGSGKATVLPLTGASVHGVLYALDDADLDLLDDIEGRGRGYDRRLLTIHRDQHEASAFAYVAPPECRDARLMPFDWYLALVVAGAHEHEMVPEWIARLADRPCIPDPDTTRPRQIEARALLDQCPPDWRPC